MSKGTITRWSDNAVKAAEALVARNKPDLEVVVSSKKQLMIDYDLEELPDERLSTSLSLLRTRVGKGELVYRTYRSGSGKHWHVVVEMPVEMDDVERSAWQLVFGSDYKRDALGLISVARHVKNPVLLFMKKHKRAVEVVTVPERPSRKFKTE